MPSIIKSVYKFRYLWLVITGVVLLALYLLMFRKPADMNKAPGPAYDLIFAVNTFNPNLNTDISMVPFVFNDTLFIQCEKLPASQSRLSTWVKFYRYNSKKGVAEPLAAPTPDELRNITGTKIFPLGATEHIRLNTDTLSPDGYQLAEPGWVKVNPVRNVLGNVVLFLLSGKFQDITEREETPRLNKGNISISIKCRQAILNNEADNAYLLGWIVPEHTSSVKSAKQ